MNFSTIAKALLPKNSPLLSKVDQAQQIAAQFSQSKSGVLDLIRQYNIGQERLQQAVQTLNNPLVSGLLNRFQPGLPDKLRSAASEISAEMPTQGQSQAQQALPSGAPQAQSASSSDVDALRKRLSQF